MQIFRSFTAVFAALTSFGTPLSAEIPTLSTYGTPGLVDLPTASVLPDGHLSFGVSYSELGLRNNFTFQVLPKLTGTFRYTVVESDVFYDRSFDLHYQLLNETDTRPSLAMGLRDIIGTGVYSGEYIVATKTVSEVLQVTGGLGWGRFAGRNSFDNPLSVFGLSSEERIFNNPASLEFSGTGGQLETGRWFQGPASFFAGLDWAFSDQLSVQLEYSNDDYGTERLLGGTKISSPFNASVQYSPLDSFYLKAYVIGGENFGVQLNYVLNPTERFIKGGREPFPQPIRSSSDFSAGDVEEKLRRNLSHEGLVLDGSQIDTTSARVYVGNNRWDVEAQAAGRTARVLTNSLPLNVEDFTVVFQERGVPISSVSTKRSDLEELQYHYDAAWLTRVRANIDDANQVSVAQSKLDFSFEPYTAFSFFDPQSPIRVDVGAQLSASYRVLPGFTLDARLRYPFAGNLGDTDRESDSVLPRVRSEAFLFARDSELEVNTLTAEYIWRPAPETFGRMTAGYLENQFGGVSAEALWYPIDSRMAYGAEINYVRQRDFDMLFGFQDLDAVTGHFSGYYDFGNGFHTQVDIGRYLAGDWGGTLTVNREFNNGVRVGGYFTLTDVPFDKFGEGSFDKGLTLEIPLSFFTGQPTRRVLKQNLQAVNRDGGARLNVSNRLYPLVRDYRGAELSDGWGRYLR
ncbi:hypothetical protein FHS72_003556 [Loktanella ponticola]|uniref:YjbH domain-containing protein n=1 Tax=Yoonia ponticola TaxID=1524255 RepID=A0A7W9EZN5_9RHOB|nr:YjbH domain-containing protein [Yoonia ponticola]MBB5723909.1 hypothetical protein [Yoonia ponticola]